MPSGMVGSSDSGTWTISFKTESVGWTATRLVAVIVTRKRTTHRNEEPRGWWRRLFGRRPPRSAAEASPVQYDAEEREVRVLDRRWSVPRGELALAVVIDLGDGASGPPAVSTRTFPAPTVPKEPFKADPRASRRKTMKRLLEHAHRHERAEEEAWRAAFRADPELRAFLSPEIDSFLGERR